MKKRMIMFALLLMAMVSVQAQSLLGTWKSTMTDKDGDKLECFMTFAAGQKVTMKMVQDLSDADVGTFEITVTFPGTYTLKDKVLNMKLDASKSDVKFSKMKFNSEVEGLFKEMPELKKTITDTMNKAMEESKVELAKELPFEGDMRVLSLTATTLKLESDSEVTTFTKTR